MVKKKKTYLVLKAVSSDKTGKYFEPGDYVTDKDFPAEIISHWVDVTKGVLKEVEIEEEAD